MKKQGRLIISTLIVLLVVIFAWLNVQKTTINFGVTKVTMPLVIVLVLAFLLGAVVAVIVSYQTVREQQKEISSLKSKADLKKQVEPDTKSEENEK
ncbi:Uncharacterized integral membrane protein [Ligilactobacillus sp. WC1T17]|uniref:Uncharacterized integral membrane protein n=1 Tax=Ligilactobacillus ruminis TaxID=1623 RepID=A0ABY1A9K9_9LACO|nr:Uncharacterized integral membrane protein [Ligilactobacillus ruminis]